MSTFLIGAATAAHQVEGNNTHSDFWVQEHLKHSDFVEPSGQACDHYHRYEEDIRLLAGAGCNAYRFSIEWARIESEEGRFDEQALDHYRDVIDCCRENGVTPIVTLHHFSSPAWLISKGGWGKDYVVTAFARYARYVAEHIDRELPYICTINEANMGGQLQKIAADMMKAGKRKEGDVQVGQNSGLDMKAILLGMFEQGRAFHTSPFGVNTSSAATRAVPALRRGWTRRIWRACRNFPGIWRSIERRSPRWIWRNTSRTIGRTGSATRA